MSHSGVTCYAIDTAEDGIIPVQFFCPKCGYRVDANYINNIANLGICWRCNAKTRLNSVDHEARHIFSMELTAPLVARIVRQYTSVAGLPCVETYCPNCETKRTVCCQEQRTYRCRCCENLLTVRI